MDVNFVIKTIQNAPSYKGQKIALYRGALRPKMLIVGEYSSLADGEAAEPFSGRNGNLIDLILTKFKLDKTTGLTNVVPYTLMNSVGTTKYPSIMDISYFRPYIIKLISRIQPELVVCMGNASTKAVMGYGVDTCFTKFFTKNSVFYTGLKSINYYNSDGESLELDFSIIYKNYFIDVV